MMATSSEFDMRRSHSHFILPLKAGWGRERKIEWKDRKIFSFPKACILKDVKKIYLFIQGWCVGCNSIWKHHRVDLLHWIMRSLFIDTVWNYCCFIQFSNNRIDVKRKFNCCLVSHQTWYFILTRDLMTHKIWTPKIARKAISRKISLNLNLRFFLKRILINFILNSSHTPKKSLTRWASFNLFKCKNTKDVKASAVSPYEGFWTFFNDWKSKRKVEPVRCLILLAFV